MYNVYAVQSNACYYGMSLIGANSAEEANDIIDKFVDWDKKNECDSWGYMHVDESDVIEGVHSEKSGIIYYGIRYGG